MGRAYMTEDEGQKQARQRTSTSRTLWQGATAWARRTRSGASIETLGPPLPTLQAHQLVDGDRQVAHALAGGVEDRIGDRRRRADDADFAHALDAERVDLVVLLLDEDHVDRGHVRVGGHVIIGEVMGHEAAEPV